MRRITSIICAMLFMAAGFTLRAQNGPWTNTDWPSVSILTTNIVSYGIFDTTISDFPSTPQTGNWMKTMSLNNCCDSTVGPIMFDGFSGQQMTSSYLNITDTEARQWANTPVLDLLLQVYGDNSIIKTNGNGKELVFHIGTLTPGVQTNITGQFLPPAARNFHWDWVLLTITNPVSPSSWNTNLPLQNYIGFIATTTNITNGAVTVVPNQGQNSGQNGGTINIQANTNETFGGLSVRAAALGPQGSFGTSNQINVNFAAAPPCPPEPVNNNLVYVDINKGITNNLIVLNNAGQGENVNFVTDGPANDQRQAVQGAFYYINTAILSNYLGSPCLQNTICKVGVEFYEDPNLIGNWFGPESWAADTKGSTTLFSGTGTQLNYTNRGSGTWVKVAFWIPTANLTGINDGVSQYPGTNYTGIARLTWYPVNSQSPSIDRIEMGVVRGDGPLTGVDPIPDYFINPIICNATNTVVYVGTNSVTQTVITNTIPGYHYSAELVVGVWTNQMSVGGTANLDGGTAGPDQRYLIEYWPTGGVTGSTSDIRYSIRPTHGDLNYQFVINANYWGPTFQDNLDLIASITYYDDPNLVGASFGPQAISYNTAGVAAIHNPSSPRQFITGTGKWLTAYQEIPLVNLVGVNQTRSPVRFESVRPPGNTNIHSGDIHISRIRYDVLRPCGPYMGIDYLQPFNSQNLSPVGDGVNQNVSFRGTAHLQGAPAITGPWTELLSVTNINLVNNYVAALPPAGPGYFRLKYDGSVYSDQHWSNGYYTNYVQVFTNTNGAVGPVSRVITTNTPVTFTTNVINGTNMIVTNAGNFTTNFFFGPSNVFYF